MSVYDKLDATDEFGGIRSRPDRQLLGKKAWRFDGIPFEISGHSFNISTVIAFELREFKPINPSVQWIGLYYSDGYLTTYIANWVPNLGFRIYDPFPLGNDLAATVEITDFLEHNQSEVVQAALDLVMRAWDIYKSDVRWYIIPRSRA